MLEELKGAPEVELGSRGEWFKMQRGPDQAECLKPSGSPVLKSRLMIKSHSKKEYGRQQVIIGYNCFSLTYPEMLYD